MESAQDTFHKREGLGGRWEKDEHQDQSQQPDPHLSPNKMRHSEFDFIGGAQPWLQDAGRAKAGRRAGYTSEYRHQGIWRAG